MMVRDAWRTALVLVVALGALAIPSNAAALTPPAPHPDPCRITDTFAYPCDTLVTSLATYKGWAHVTVGLYCGGAAPDGFFLGQLQAPRPAYRWSGTAWQLSSLATSTQVYVWPYAVDWSWVWTQRTGWLAMRDEHLVINPRFECYWPYGPPPAAARQ